MKTYTLLAPTGPRTRARPPAPSVATAGAGSTDAWTARPRGAPSRRAATAPYRVFFADEETAIAAGYRPCHTCLREAYTAWKAAQPSAG